MVGSRPRCGGHTRTTSSSFIFDELCKPDLVIADELGNSPCKREHGFAGVFFELVRRPVQDGSQPQAASFTRRKGSS